MKRLRKIIFWCHLPIGLVSGVIILLMCVTGVLLTYEKQIVTLVDSTRYKKADASPNSEKVRLKALIATARDRRQQMPTAVITYSDQSAPVEVAFGREAPIFVDRFSGQITGEGSSGVRQFFRTVTDWHRWLGAQGPNREIARAITGACNLGFLGLVLSGFYLWWPRRWSFNSLRNAIFFKSRLRGKARDFNWHNVIGFWTAVPLVIVITSAVVISYPWASNLVYRVVGEAPPKPRSPQPSTPSKEAGTNSDLAQFKDLDQAFATAQQQVQGWRSVTFQIPSSKDADWTFNIDRGTGGQPQERSQVAIDQATGNVTRFESFSTNSPGRRLRTVMRFAHTGEVLGMAGQTVAGLASLGGIFLVCTGFSLAWRRFRAWLGARTAVITSREVVEQSEF